MGKSSSANDTYTVTYHAYKAGWHMVPCLSAHETHLLKLEVNDVAVWEGDLSYGSTLTINEPELFGGREREGGVVGKFTFLTGFSTQEPNGYLQNKMDGAVPAYRGVVSLISEGAELQQNNPFLKPWKQKLACFHGDWRTDLRTITGLESYEVTTSEIIRDETEEPSSCTWSEFTAGRCDLPDGSSYTPDPINGRQDFPPDDQRDQWVEEVDPVGGESTWTYVGDTFTGSEMDDYYDEGAISPIYQNSLPTYSQGFNIVETVTEEERTILLGINPMHIIYEVFTNTSWGGGYGVTLLDLDALAEAAQILYDEGFALSLFWTHQTSIDGFIGLVMDHVNGVWSRRPDNGQYRVKLLRSGDTPVFDVQPEHIVRFEEYEEGGWAESINEVTVKYTDVSDGKSKSVTVHDLAAIERSGGRIISQTKEYRGLPTLELAERVARRDLALGSSPVKRVKLAGDRRLAGLTTGDVISITFPLYGLNGDAFRVVEIDYGTQTENGIGLSAVSDIFVVDTPGSIASKSVKTVTRAPPVNVSPARVFEAPYWFVDRVQSATGFPEEILYSESYVLAAAGVPQPSATKFYSYFQYLSDPVERGSNGDWSGVILTGDELVETQTDVLIDRSYAKALESFQPGTLVLIGQTEIAEVVFFDLRTWLLTINRGMLDTLPKGHPRGVAVVTLRPQDLAHSYVDWTAGDVVKAKLLTSTPSGVLPYDQATELPVTIRGRQGRPLPPGGLSVNGAYLPVIFTGTLEVSWNHRNRKTQTTDLHVKQTDGNVIPEEGTSYRLQIFDNDNVLVKDISLFGDGVLESPAMTAYQHNPGASAEYDAGDGGIYLMACSPGYAHTGAGFVSDKVYSAGSSTSILFTFLASGSRYPVYGALVGVVPDGFSREGYYGHPTQMLGGNFGSGAAWDYPAYGVATWNGFLSQLSETLTVGVSYEMELRLDWVAGTYELYVDAVKKTEGAIPPAEQAFKDAFRVILHYPGYETTGSLQIGEFSVKVDETTLLDSYTYDPNDEIADSGDLNTRLRVRLWAERDGLQSWEIWDHEFFRAAQSVLLDPPNLDFSDGSLTGWDTLSGTPVARSNAELGFSGCGASGFAMGNPGGDLSGSWQAKYDFDLTTVVDTGLLDAGLVVLELGLRHRALSAGPSGDIDILFLDENGALLETETSPGFFFSLGVWGSQTLYAPIPPGARIACPVISARGTSSSNSGYIGCVTFTLHGRLYPVNSVTSVLPQAVVAKAIDSRSRVTAVLPQAIVQVDTAVGATEVTALLPQIIVPR